MKQGFVFFTERIAKAIMRYVAGQIDEESLLEIVNCDFNNVTRHEIVLLGKKYSKLLRGNINEGQVGADIFFQLSESVRGCATKIYKYAR